ncbi:MAG: DUF120 domain-containing protein [Candidatus Odinarchaeia archaeon]
MDPRLWFTLLKIAQLESKKLISTNSLGELLGKSQQTASRYIRELENLGLIKRIIQPNGQRIILTEEGDKKLREIYLTLKSIFIKEQKPYVLKGTVFTGLGEGAYYVSHPYYREKFNEKLGFDPYLGTLNLRLIDISFIKIRKIIESMPGIVIESFKNDTRSFGKVKCFRATINNKVEGALIFIQRTHHQEDVIEVISDKNLRKSLNLKDGDIVELMVKTS